MKKKVIKRLFRSWYWKWSKTPELLGGNDFVETHLVVDDILKYLGVGYYNDKLHTKEQVLEIDKIEKKNTGIKDGK